MISETAASILEARQLSYVHNRVRVLRDISFTVPRREVLGIIGPNGSGKTTLLRLLTGFLKPAAGSVLYKGRPLQAYGRRTLAKEIALVPQITETHFAFTVEQIVMMGRHAHLGSAVFESRRDMAVVREAMEFTDTLRFAERSFNALSGGERQRVIIASALAQHPRLLFLDEPTTSLDIRYQAEIFEILHRLNDQRDYTIVIVLHDLNLAARFCTSLLVLKKGRVAASGKPERILKNDFLEQIYETEVEVINPGRNGRFTMMPRIGKNPT